MKASDYQDAFWARFRVALARSPVAGLSCLPQSKGHNHLMRLAAGPGWEVAVRFNVQNRRIEADLTLSGESAKQNFDTLKRSYAAGAERALNSSVCWEREKKPRPNYPTQRNPESSIFTRLEGIDPKDPNRYDEYVEWLIPRAVR